MNKEKKKKEIQKEEKKILIMVITNLETERKNSFIKFLKEIKIF